MTETHRTSPDDMAKTARLLVIVLVVLGCVGCDRVTKSEASAYLVPGATISLAEDTIRLEYTENPGAFLGLGSSLPAWVRMIVLDFGGLALIAAAIIWALTSPRMSASQAVGAALICGGGLGNLIDRFIHSGYVVDFLNVGIGPLRTGIFNVADFALLAGMTILAMSWTFDDRSRLPG